MFCYVVQIIPGTEGEKACEKLTRVASFIQLFINDTKEEYIYLFIEY